MPLKKKLSFQCEFGIRFTYQAVVWKGMLQKGPIFQNSWNFICRFSGSDLVLTKVIKLEPLILNVSSRQVFAN